jgi:uncharacterized YccA/Bax inhibitor family protein
MRSTNPVFNTEAFAGARGVSAEAAMTVQGAVNRTAMLLAVLLVASSWVWGRALAGGPVQGLVLLGALGGFITALVTVFQKTWAPVSAPIYAAFEGLALGGVSAMLEARYPGIVMNAVALTFGTLGALLMAYKSGLIQVTHKFRLGIVAATGGIALVYLVSWIMSFFGARLAFLYNSSPLSIGISVVIVIIAALNLVLDFDFIERGAEQRLPKYMEWYAAFGLMVTMVWLYLEILRLLGKTRSRR